MRRTVTVVVIGLLSALFQALAGTMEVPMKDVVRRVFRTERSVRGNENIRLDQKIDKAAWIWMPDDERYGEAAMMAGRGDRTGFPARFYRFRCPFDARGTEPLRFDVSADERFILFVDGEEFARGPHRGDGYGDG